VITFTDVSKRFPDGTLAVAGLSLELRSGEITVLLGSSAAARRRRCG
jgi:osmoprotectant transport system ATP-binding protein